MPWVPELFSAPALEQVLEKRRQKLIAIPYFDGLMAGETDALVRSFAATPELHDPLRGRVKGAGAFREFASETHSWLVRHDVSVEDVNHVVEERRGFEEVVLHFEDEQGRRVELPVAIAADRRQDGRIEELRIYFSNWSLSGHHANRPPLLQPDPKLHESGIVGEYLRALAAGDGEAVVATFEPDGYAREPAGGRHVHRGRDGLRSFYKLLFSNGGGIQLEGCATIDDGRSCALEYNVARWGATEMTPQAGVAVFVRGGGGRLEAARIYDDADPPFTPPA
jgi:SnoaL-like domain